jgi:hypothetical protein
VPGHFQAEDRHRQTSLLDADMFGDVQAKAVLPIDGRPATTIMSPGCRAGCHHVEIV